MFSALFVLASMLLPSSSSSTSNPLSLASSTAVDVVRCSVALTSVDGLLVKAAALLFSFLPGGWYVVTSPAAPPPAVPLFTFSDPAFTAPPSRTVASWISACVLATSSFACWASASAAAATCSAFRNFSSSCLFLSSKDIRCCTSLSLSSLGGSTGLAIDGDCFGGALVSWLKYFRIPS